MNPMLQSTMMMKRMMSYLRQTALLPDDSFRYTNPTQPCMTPTTGSANRDILLGAIETISDA